MTQRKLKVEQVNRFNLNDTCVKISFTFCSLLFIFHFLILTPAQAHAQTDIVKLKVGDKVPDIILEGIYNYQHGRARISDFRGKLLILDFWNINCSPCIKSFPRFQLIQEKYKGKIQVLLVNVFNSLKVLESKGFPKNTKSTTLNETKLPFIINSKQLAELFPHIGEPYQVWINEIGEVVALTNGEALTETNIVNYLNGLKIEFPQVIDPREVEMTAYASVLNSRNPSILGGIKYSFFVCGNLNIKGWDNYIYDSISGNIVGYRGSGYALYLFRSALNVSLPDRYLLETSSREILVGPNEVEDPSGFAAWKEANYLYYELKFPSTYFSRNTMIDRRDEVIKVQVKNELEHYLNVDACVEKRKVLCGILVRVDPTKVILAKEGAHFFEANDREIVIENMPFSVLMTRLRLIKKTGNPVPLINETGLGDQQNVDIRLIGPLDNTQLLRKELNRYGLDLLEEEREIEMLVIKDRK